IRFLHCAECVHRAAAGSVFFHEVRPPAPGTTVATDAAVDSGQDLGSPRRNGQAGRITVAAKTASPRNRTVRVRGALCSAGRSASPSVRAGRRSGANPALGKAVPLEKQEEAKGRDQPSGSVGGRGGGSHPAG